MVGEDIRTRAALNYDTVCELKAEIKRLNQAIIYKDREAVRN